MTSTSSKLAVVTGAAGFIGGHLVRHLEEHGYRVRCIDIKYGQDITQGPSDDALLAFFAGADVVFHLAGLADVVPSIERPQEYFEINTQGTINILEAARASGVRKFVYAASSSCYGDKPPVPTQETAPLNPGYPYAMSKMMGEQAVLHWEKVYGMQVVSLRIFNAYGVGMKATDAYGGVFKVFLPQRLIGAPLTIVGRGDQFRDFVHVSDVCRAFRLAAESDASGVYNLGSGKPQSINYLAKLIGGETIHVPDRPGEPMVTWANINRLEQHTGWKPEVRFEDGVGGMLYRLEDWKDAPVWTTERIAEATKTWREALA